MTMRHIAAASVAGYSLTVAWRWPSTNPPAVSANNKQRPGMELFPSLTYHSPMRRLLFIAMIFLLFLRGMVGDAMATGMAAGHLQRISVATEFVAAHAHETRADGHFDHGAAAESMTAAAPPDCAGHATGNASDSMTQEATGHCESCAACQACNTVALSPLTSRTASLAIPPALPHSPAAQFASALAALGQKPPIS
jgi:hypothetical protein